MPATAELNLLVFDMEVTEDRWQGAESIARRWPDDFSGPEADVLPLLETTCALIGTVDQIVAEIQRWRERLGVSYVVINGERHLQAFAPVVQRLAGT